MSVGVMEDYKLKDLLASHTLGWSWNAPSRLRLIRKVTDLPRDRTWRGKGKSIVQD